MLQIKDCYKGKSTREYIKVPFISVNVAVTDKVPIDNWHRRLRHPAYETLNFILDSYNLGVHGNKSFCEACQQIPCVAL